MKIRKLKRDPISTVPRQPMFSPYSSPAIRPPPFFRPTPTSVITPTMAASSPVIQRQETAEPEAAEAETASEKSPLMEGLKTVGAQAMKIPQFKAWFEPQKELFKQLLWEERPSDEKAALITFGGVNLGLAGLVIALNPNIRETLLQEWLPGANVGAPLGAIPYSPIEGFKYRLPKPGQSAYGFSGDFTLDPYLDLLHRRYPNLPQLDASFGLDTTYTPGQGLAATGGRFSLGLFGGGIKAQGKSFTELSPYPTLIPGATPFEPSSMLMQSVPGLPPLQTGPGFQFMLSVDLVKLGTTFPRLKALF